MRELGDEASVPFELGKLMPQDLPSADEVLLSSTAGGIMPVGYVNNRVLGMGLPVVLSRQLRGRYRECHDEDWHGTPVDYRRHRLCVSNKRRVYPGLGQPHTLPPTIGKIGHRVVTSDCEPAFRSADKFRLFTVAGPARPRYVQKTINETAMYRGAAQHRFTDKRCRSAQIIGSLKASCSPTGIKRYKGELR